MRNMYPGTCYKCGRHVPTGLGFFERVNFKEHGRKWRVQCVECADGRTIDESDPAVKTAEKRRDAREQKAGCKR